MEYTQIYNAKNERCDVEKNNLKGNDRKGLCELGNECYKSPFWRGYLLGLFVGTLITAVLLLTLNTKTCDVNSSSGETVHLRSNKSASGSFTTSKSLYFTTEQTTDATRYPTIAPPPLTPHTCQVKGGCTDQPKSQEGTECLFESKDGRTSAAYAAHERKSVDTFDHCPVSICTHGSWSSFNISQSDKECFTVDYKGQAIYTGKNTCTVSGRTCQRWDRDYPHKRNQKHVPKNWYDLHSNYCRDEGPPYSRRLWCYTTDRKVRWEYCYVPQC